MRAKKQAALGLVGLLVLAGVLATSLGAQDGSSSAISHSAATNMMLSKGFHFGPVIDSFGPVVAIDSELAIPTDHQYKVVFEFIPMQPADSPEETSPMLDSVARFINMQVEAGVPKENLDIKVVIHGMATTDVLNNEAYRARFGVDSPHVPLFEVLSEAGVDFYVCGQAARIFDVPRDDIAAPVQVALSAMTAVVLFQSQGYQVLAYGGR